VKQATQLESLLLLGLLVVLTRHQHTTPQSGDISALSETFGRVDITTGERPGPTRFTSFDNSSSRVGGIK
jgi:hypothetical protein